jgi:hypothetical protein
MQDSYKLNFYMLAKLPLQQEILINCWNMLLHQPFFHYPQFYFHILALFRFFNRWIANYLPSGEAEFLRFQLSKAEEVAVKLDSLISETDVLQRVEELLSFK